VSSYDPAVLVRNARIAENYRFDIQSRLAKDEAVKCVACGFQSRLPGTPVFNGAGSTKTWSHRWSSYARSATQPQAAHRKPTADLDRGGSVWESNPPAPLRRPQQF
jgi:hypothetical protein